MFILYTKINNEQKRTKKPKNGVQYEHIEHNVHSGHPVSVQIFQPLSVIYRRGNFVYHYWGCTLYIN